LKHVPEAKQEPPLAEYLPFEPITSMV